MNNLKEFNMKNSTCYYFHDRIKIEDFNFDILIDEKSYGNILFYGVSS